MSNSSHPEIHQLDSLDLNSLPEDGGPDFNRLVFEKSPYLLQHAANPIDWRPWSEETLAVAKKRDQPIFLSIGYSTCHWCHVMAEESFSDTTVAELLLDNFIAIKVDREERSDVDATYMQACQIMTGSGGWPLSLILTPDLLPFFAATYIPKNNRHGMTGLISLLQRIAALWKTERARIEDSGKQIYELLKKTDSPPAPEALPGDEILRQALRDYSRQFDALYGGFGQAPKFPAPHNLSLLLHTGHLLDNPKASAMALDTLRSIRLGGIYDQLGGGIHRYSVDERWLVPHFEKMLYDQALLMNAAIDCWLSSGDTLYRDLATDTACFVCRSLTSSDGGFYCGEDADSEGEEGTSYLWSTDEVAAHFPNDTAIGIIRTFGMTPSGNFEGRNILHLPEGLDGDLIDTARNKLLPIRNSRPQPHLDDKIITGWNGLMIAAMARLGGTTGDEEWSKRALASAHFIKTNLRSDTGRLLRRWRRGEAAIPAFLDDYTFLIWGLIELYQSLFRTEHLQWALQLTDEMLDLFTDNCGGLFDTGKDAEKILTRGRILQDGATPSGNGTAAMILARLGLLTGREDLRLQAEQILQSNAGVINRYPTAFSVSLLAASYLGRNASTLVIAGNESNCNEFLHAARSNYHPTMEIMVIDGNRDELERIAPIIRGKETKQNQATAWLCQNRSCREPATSPEQLAELLK